MFADFWVVRKVVAFNNGSLKCCKLIFKAGWKDSKTHYFYKSYIFLLYMVQVCVRVKDPKRVFFCRNVIAQHKVQFILAVMHTGNRCNCVVFFPVSFRKDASLCICVNAPALKDFIRQVYNPVRISSVKPDYAHRPLYYATLDIFIPLDLKLLLKRGPGHGKLVSSPLKVVVA